MINYQTPSYNGLFQIIRNRHYSPDVLPIKNLPIPTVYGKHTDATPFSLRLYLILDVVGWAHYSLKVIVIIQEMNADLTISLVIFICLVLYKATPILLHGRKAAPM